MQKLIEKQKPDGKIYFFSFAVSEDCKTAFVREAFEDAEGLIANRKHTGPYLIEFMKAGVLKVDRVELHGPGSELEKLTALKEELKAINP